MADTFTPHYNLTKPQVGGDPDTWGDLLNANFDLIDAGIFAAKTVADASVALDGSKQMSGSLLIATQAGFNAQLNLNKFGSGVSNQILGSTSGSSRWLLRLGDGTAESGANLGSDFSLTRYTDGGSPLDSPVVISRQTGIVAFAQRPTFAGATPYDTGNLNTANFALKSGAAFTGAVSVGGTGLTVSTAGQVPNLTLFDTTQGGQLRIQGATSGAKTFRIGTLATLEIVNNAYSAVVSSLTDGGVWTATDFSATSDPRLKDEIAPLLRGLDELKRMRPREYVKYDNEEFLGEGKPEIGFLADEVEEVVPEAIGGQGGYRTVSYGQLTALLASAILELDRRLTLAGV